MTVVGVIAIVELGRRTGVAVPVPFLMLYGSVAIAAGLAGLRIGIACATIAAAFVVYCSMQNFGPPSLTGGPLQILTGVFVAYLAGVLLGRHHDKLSGLMRELESRDRELTRMHGLLEDKVERRTHQLAELSTELTSVRNRLDSAVQHSPAGVVVVDADGKIISANDAALRMFGLSNVAARWLDACELFEQEGIRIETSYGQQRTGALSSALRAGQVTDGVNVHLTLADGTKRQLRCSFAPVCADHGDIDGATIVCLDETKLAKSERSLKKLARRLIKVQEDERAHIARELHDEIGQHLTGIKMLLHAVATNPADHIGINTSIEKIDELMRVVRNLSLELRPSILDDLGLVAGLRWFLGRLHVPSSCGIHFDSQAATAGLSPEATTASFRIVQEAVNNAIKYADAANIYIRLCNVGDDFCVQVEDDGLGFDQNDLASGEEDRMGFGLLFMRERAQEFSGSFRIRSKPGEGTVITVKFPIAVAG